MIDLKLLAKGGVIVLIIVSVAVLIEQLTWSGGTLNDSSDKVLPIIDPLWPSNNDTTELIYNEDFIKCLEDHSKNSYFPITQGKNISISCVPAGRCIHNFLIHSTKLLDSLNLRLILLEPSLLFCLLPSSRKYNLLTRGFIATNFKGSKNVITFGVDSSQAKILDEVKTRKRLASFRYKILRLPEKSDDTLMDSSLGPAAHYFLIRYDMVLHIIVLYPRETFLFSSAFDYTKLNTKGLQYVNDRAFENFTTSTAYLDASSFAPVLLPTDTRCFLLDMMSSEFIKCKDETLDMMSSQSTETVMALKELKSVLASQMVIFWLWSKSLYGWYEKCDIQHYSEELKFSVAAKSVEGFNFTALFINSFCHHTETLFDAGNNISSVQLNCYDVKIQLTFMNEDKITYWTEYVDPESIYKLRFPKFSLCSTEVYGEKVNIPCETSELLDSEYGQFLKNTTLKLDPESMKNVMLLMKRK